jgi:hypothetical protein
MNLNLSIYARGACERRLFSKTISDVYVEEEQKIGNDTNCTFFAGEHVDNVADVNEIIICVRMDTLDDDGLDWGGDHIHYKSTNGLQDGKNFFVEQKEHSNNPGGTGVYELSYTIVRHCN